MRYNLLLIIAITVVPLIGRADDADFEKVAEAQWNQVNANTISTYESHEKREQKSWKAYQARIKQKWADGAIPEQKTYVQYFNDDTTRIKVDYEQGTLIAETLLDSKDQSKDAKEKIKTAVTSVIGGNTPNAIVGKDEIGSASVETTAATEEPTVAGDGKPRTLYRVTLRLVPDFIKKRAEKFKPIVDTWANKHKLDPAYVLAIIRQESSFNPRARSWVPALGLMQIVPHYAGQEVLKAVTGKNTKPDEEFLYDPVKNIMVGTTYRQILRDQYFPSIKDKTKQMYLMTASYNWGPHRIQKAIKQGRIPASASSAETFDTIQRIAPTETQGYVRKVSEYFIEFKKMGY